MIRSRRFALVAIVFSFGIAACGDPATTRPLANQPKVIQLAGGHWAPATEGVPAAAAMPSGGGAVDRKMVPFAPTQFVYDGDLPVLDGAAPSWSFAAGQQPDLQQIAKLAKSLGVEGEVRPLPQDQGGGWAVGPQDYSGPVLTVGSDGMLSWSFSSASATVSSGCAVASTAPNTGSGGGGTTGTAVLAPPPPVTVPTGTTPAADVPLPVPAPDCQAPPPPVGVPTKDEALAKVKELFASWGYDINSYQFDAPYADEWNASVNASLVVGGMKAPISLSVGFGANAAVTYAQGSLAVPQQGSDYPTVGVAKGLERLKTQQYQYMGTGGGIMRDAIGQVAPQTAAVGSGVAEPGVAVVAPDIATTTGVGDVVAVPATVPGVGDPGLPACPTDAATGTPVTILNSGCLPVNIEPVTVTLNSVKRDLTMVWAADGTIWLLPAYTFGSADGGTYTVIAVADEFIQQPAPEPSTTEPAQDPNSTVIHPDTVVPVPATVTTTAAPTP